MNFCNGHGFCEPATDTCDCYEGWGAKTDVALYKLHDCSGQDVPVRAGLGRRRVRFENRTCPGGVLGQGHL